MLRIGNSRTKILDHTRIRQNGTELSFFNKPAETIGQYVKKGQQLYVEGRLQTRKWQDKDGIEKFSTDIISDNFTFVGSKSDSSDAFTPKSQDNNDFSNQDIIKDEDIPF